MELQRSCNSPQTMSSKTPSPGSTVLLSELSAMLLLSEDVAHVIYRYVHDQKGFSALSEVTGLPEAA